MTDPLVFWTPFGHLILADIAQRGVQVPVEYDEEGNILDGYHRVRACQELDITDWPKVVRRGLTEEQKRAHAMVLNLHRRHLTREQRRDLVAKLRGQGWSLRRIADVLGVGFKTVHRDIEGVSNDTPGFPHAQGREPPSAHNEHLKRGSPHAQGVAGCRGVNKLTPERITGADGKQYPATKPAPVELPDRHEAEAPTPAPQPAPAKVEAEEVKRAPAEASVFAAQSQEPALEAPVVVAAASAPKPHVAYNSARLRCPPGT